MLQLTVGSPAHKYQLEQYDHILSQQNKNNGNNHLRLHNYP